MIRQILNDMERFARTMSVAQADIVGRIHHNRGLLPHQVVENIPLALDGLDELISKGIVEPYTADQTRMYRLTDRGEELWDCIKTACQHLHRYG